MVELNTDYSNKKAEILVYADVRGLRPVKTITLKPSDNEESCPEIKELSETDQEALGWFWHDMGFLP